ncbi:MAG: hypothetical protein WDM77_08735 [Steroidobacteraceae bacterium]
MSWTRCGNSTPIQMVHFVLDDPRMEPFHGTLEKLSLGVLATIVQAALARHYAAQTRH